MTETQKLVGRESDKFMLRMPEGMRERIAELAKKNGRSMNAEIVTRLQWALPLLDAPKILEPVPPESISGLPPMLELEIGMIAKESGITFEEALIRTFAAGVASTAPQVVYINLHPGATAKDLRTVFDTLRDVIKDDAAIITERITKSPPKNL